MSVALSVMLSGLSSVIVPALLLSVATGLSLLPRIVSVIVAVSIAPWESVTWKIKLSETLSVALRLSKGVNRSWLPAMVTLPKLG